MEAIVLLTIFAIDAVVFRSRLRGAENLAVDEDDAVDVANSTDDNVAGVNAIDDNDNDFPAGGMKMEMNIS